MIGNPLWFTRRKWGGWGLYPVCWQGWVYILAFVALLLTTQYLFTDRTVQMIALGIVGIILVADTIVIMATLKRDERETLHEAIAERNAMWTMVFVLAGGLAYQVASSTIRHETPYVDPVILIALFSALAVKAITNYRLR